MISEGPYLVRGEEHTWGRIYAHEESDGTFTLTWETRAGEQPSRGRSRARMEELIANRAVLHDMAIVSHVARGDLTPCGVLCYHPHRACATRASRGGECMAKLITVLKAAGASDETIRTAKRLGRG